jgi:hypothetical protein
MNKYDATTCQTLGAALLMALGTMSAMRRNSVVTAQ